LLDEISGITTGVNMKQFRDILVMMRNAGDLDDTAVESYVQKVEKNIETSNKAIENTQSFLKQY
jgi:hypothetical protein